MTIFDNLVMSVQAVMRSTRVWAVLLGIGGVCALPASTLADSISVSKGSLPVNLPTATGPFSDNINDSSWVNVGTVIINISGSDPITGALLDGSGKNVDVFTRYKETASYKKIESTRNTDEFAMERWKAIQYVDRATYTENNAKKNVTLDGLINFKSINTYNPFDSKIALRVYTAGGRSGDTTTSQQAQKWVYVPAIDDSNIGPIQVGSDGSRIELGAVVFSYGSSSDYKRYGRSFTMQIKASNPNTIFAGTYEGKLYIRFNYQ